MPVESNDRGAIDKKPLRGSRSLFPDAPHQGILSGPKFTETSTFSDKPQIVRTPEIKPLFAKPSTPDTPRINPIKEIVEGYKEVVIFTDKVKAVGRFLDNVVEGPPEKRT